MSAGPHPTGLTVTWLGHSTTVLELEGSRLITDPLLRNRVAHLRRTVGPVGSVGEVDGILVSHAHRDHLDLPSLRRLSGQARVVVPAGLGRLVRRSGHRDVLEVRPGDTVEVNDVRVVVTEARHDSGRGLWKRGPRPVSFLIGDEIRTLFVGDTDVYAAMSELRGQLDVALLPISGWGPRVPAGHLDAERAALALLLLEPRTCIPIHWGTFRPVYRLTPYESDATAPARFTAFAASLAPDVGVRILRPGGRLTFA
jgi:L-ascorbate metabolism protein UlaG (beta-lactamase superfamily)